MKDLLSLIIIILFLFLAIPYSFYFGLAFKYSNKGSPVRKSEKKTTISLIIPTYNEELVIEKKINDVFKLDYPQDLFEVIIVDSSTDKTTGIIKEYQKRFNNIVLIIQNTQGSPEALNTAYAAAKNEIVIKTDCDSLLEKDVLQKIAADFSDPAIGGVAGKQAVINDSKVEIDYRSIQSKIQIAESWIDSTVIFHPLSAYRKKLIQPIDPDSLADDSELALKVRKQGYRTIFDPEILYYEASHSSFFKRRVQKDRRGKGLIRLLFRHTDVLFNPKYGNYGKIIFPVNFFMIVLSPYLILTLLLIIFYMLFQLNPVIAAFALILLILFIYLGQANKLSMFGPVYSFLDTQISLLVGGLSLVFGRETGGTWKVDKELRSAYLKND